MMPLLLVFETPVMGRKRKTAVRRIRHRYLEPVIVKASLFVAAILPRQISWLLACAAGWILAPIVSRHRSIMDVNIRNVALPLALDVKPSLVIRHTVASFLDFLHLSRRSDEFFRSVLTVRGEEYMHEALTFGKGVIAVTSHYSAWELIPRAVSLMGARVGVVGRKLWNPAVSAILDELRAKPGIELIDRGSQAMGLIRALRRNTAVGILIDQDTLTVDSRYVPFLGLEARTPVGPAGIALRSGVPVLTLHIARINRRRYLLTIDPVLDTSEMKKEEGILLLTAQLNSRIGEWIIEDPNQWVWFHKRWNRRPPGSRGLQ
jgi:KDO2-lipid IV(A) lauroyltransferase